LFDGGESGGLLPAEGMTTAFIWLIWSAKDGSAQEAGDANEMT